MVLADMDIEELERIARKEMGMIPITGNEYEQHIEAKRRVLQAMIDLDFKNIEIEKSLPCEGKSYIVDCYGEYFGGKLRAMCEILPSLPVVISPNGLSGHGYRRARTDSKKRDGNDTSNR